MASKPTSNQTPALPNNPTPRAGRPAYFKDLLLLFAVPIAVILIAAAVVYLPRVGTHPTYDFIYSVCPVYDCADTYQVNTDGRVTHIGPPQTGLENTVFDPATGTQRASDLEYQDDDLYELRYYDTETDNNRSLTYAEARQYKLNTFAKSPDGYLLAQKEEPGGFFGGSYDNAAYLEKGLKKKKVNLGAETRYYNNNIKFLGWVTNEN